jgi:predicted ATPase
MEGKRLIQRLSMRNFLSYGSEGASIDLLPLNVLIGPNGSGKSNLIEALAVLRATEGDLAGWIRQGGGINEYIWKGGTDTRVASLDVWLGEPDALLPPRPFRYSLSISEIRDRLQIVSETTGFEGQRLGSVMQDPEILYHFADGHAVIAHRTWSEDGSEYKGDAREIRIQDLKLDQSILSQRRDPDTYPEITYLGQQFSRIAIFQEWSFGRRTLLRGSQPTDLPTDFLLPDGSNFVLVLHDLLQRSATDEKLVEHLRRFYEAARRIRTRVYAGRIELFIEEESNVEIPAARLSDGTLRYLALLTILLHPSPPPLVCIEEPELGLHPDILPVIAGLLLDASKRTQLVVTTHSDALVSALSEVPEAVVVCEPSTDGTQLRRLERDALSAWLERYSLGEMWRMGELGGTRW